MDDILRDDDVRGGPFYRSLEASHQSGSNGNARYHRGAPMFSLRVLIARMGGHGVIPSLMS